MILSRRHGQLAAAPAALRHRPAGAAEVARHRGAPRAHRRRREPARPLRAALRRRASRRRTINEKIARPQPGRRGAELRLDRKGILGAHPDADLRASGNPTARVESSDRSSPSRPPTGRRARPLDDSPASHRAHGSSARRAPAMSRPSADRSSRRSIQPNYLSRRARPRACLLAGMSSPAACSAPAARATITTARFPGPARQRDDDLLAAAKQRGTTTFHPDGHLPHGRRTRSDGGGRRPAPRARPGGAARRRRLDHADACRRPTSTPPSMMIAEKAADMIRGTSASMN